MKQCMAERTPRKYSVPVSICFVFCLVVIIVLLTFLLFFFIYPTITCSYFHVLYERRLFYGIICESKR